MTAAAAQLAVDLLVEHGGGTADAGVTDVDHRAPARAVRLRHRRLPTPLRRAGLPARRGASRTLRAIGCEVTDTVDGRTPPSQVAAADLAPRPHQRPRPGRGGRAGARLRPDPLGPAAAPSRPAAGSPTASGSAASSPTTLAHQGLVEVLSYPFVAPGLFDRLGLCADDARRAYRRRWPTRCPTSSRCMRTSVLDTLLDALRRNVARGPRDVGRLRARAW